MKSSGVIYRLGRVPDPWAVPDWASAGPDGTFGNRFDDPDATYRVLYASSQKLGCFLETLARFRLDPKLMAELAEIDGDDDHFLLAKCLWNGYKGESWESRLLLANMPTSVAANGSVDCVGHWLASWKGLGSTILTHPLGRKRRLEYSPNLFRASSSTPAFLAFTTFQNTAMTSKTGLCSNPFRSP